MSAEGDTERCGLTETQVWPERGQVFSDAEGRELTVHAVRPGDERGREIRGRLVVDGREADYSTNQQTWASIWRDRAPRADVRQ